MSRRLTAVAAGLLTAASIATAPAAAASTPPQAPAAPPTLTNLAHLDFLTATVTPPPQPGHTTYLLGSEPSVGVLWVYANYLAPRQLPGHRRRQLRPREQHLRAGCLRRR